MSRMQERCAANRRCINTNLVGIKAPQEAGKQFRFKTLAERRAAGETGLPLSCPYCERIVCGDDCLLLHKCAGKVTFHTCAVLSCSQILRALHMCVGSTAG